MPKDFHPLPVRLPGVVTIDGLVCERRRIVDAHDHNTPTELVMTNVTPSIVQHSPAGFEWGYEGSGPADLALNVLAAFVPPAADGWEPVQCFLGQCSQTAWDLHQEFKRDYIATMDRDGGRIDAGIIRLWIKVRMRRPWEDCSPMERGPIDLAGDLGEGAVGTDREEGDQ